MNLNVELSLITKAKTDFKAFSEIYNYYFENIYSYCLNRLGNKPMAEEITSQVFLNCIYILQSQTDTPSKRIAPILYKTANKEIMNLFQSSRYKQLLEEQQNNPNRIILTDNQKKILLILKKLTPKYREILTFKYYSDLDDLEIAEIMDIEQEQLAVLFHRAIKEFKQMYQEKFPEDELFEII
jgi:RNA polymerase sigma-70 factor, ECF subfamily